MYARACLLIPAITMFGVATALAQTAAPADSTTLPSTSPFDSATTPAEADASSSLPAQAEEGWNFSLGIPVWIPGIGGDLTIRGEEFSPDQDNGDVADVLDTNINLAAALHFEAQNGRFGLFADAMYLDLRSTRNNGSGDTEAVFRGFIGELGAFYTVVAPEPGKRGFGAFQLDALGGVRITSVDIGIDANAADPSTSHALYDPIIGARAELGLTNWLSIEARGDVGGFGIEAWDTSDFSYNVAAGLAFHPANWLDLGLGYRWLKYDFETDSGDTTFDATLSGPYITLMFNF
jgi:opacity protein-like surface antigen